MQTELFSREENFSFWKNLVLVAIFFTITPITLGISLFSLISLKKTDQSQAESNINLITTPQAGVRVYASLPVKTPLVEGSIGSADARPEIVKQYLLSYNSPLVSLAPFIVQEADKYSIDFRLITAIAQQESNLCKIIPPGSFNCWGWGITGESTLNFNSYAEGIDVVSKGLKTDYIDEGFVTIAGIMSKYTPQSNGSWANGVSEFMTEMQ